MARQFPNRSEVLFIGRSAWAEHGGIQRFNRRVAAGLENNGLNATVMMIVDARGEMPDDTAGVRYRGFEAKIGDFASAFARATRKADVLLVGHINLMPFAALYKVLRPRGKVILFAHGIEIWNDPRYRKARFYEPALLPWAVNKVAVVSRYSQGLMAKGFSLPPGRFSLFPNAINLPSARPDCARSGANILVVSRLGANEAEKHVDKVIRALPLVRKAVPDAMVTIVGDGPLRAGLEALAGQLDVAEHVRFAGFVSDAELDEAYSQASVFALPSSKEGFGIVYLEAWARGLPVVASRFGAAPEVVGDGIDGFTVDPEDIAALADRLARLLADKALSVRFAAAGWEKLEQAYSDEAFAERLGKLCMQGEG